jgi:ribosomal protein L1
MHEDTFNMSLRKFLKKVGVTSQREIEQAVQKALDEGRIKTDAALKAKVVLSIDEIGLTTPIEGAIELE